jgi:polysaccharide biosynthesis/export protein
MPRDKLLLTIIFCLCASTQYCSAQEAEKTSVSGQDGKAVVHGSSNDPAQPKLQKRDWRYELRPGDSFSIRFPLTPEFNQQDVVVQPDGFVTLQGVGEMSVAGKSLPELRQQLQAVYAKIVSPQEITVELKDFERPYFVVGGEVGHPGKFDLRSDTTVAEAVAIAGGFKDTSKHSQVLLFRRVSDEWTEAKILDLKKMLKDGNLSEDSHLRPGDMIYVPKNLISKIKPFLPTSYVGAAYNPSVF